MLQGVFIFIDKLDKKKMMNTPYSNYSILDNYKDQNIFITGGTGFLGKVLIEKILRDISNCNKIYILIRDNKINTYYERLQKDIISSNIFNTLKKKLGNENNFLEYINNKLIAIKGDITQINLGISNDDYNLLKNNINIIIHCAATIDFNERIDHALDLNVFGSIKVLDLAKQCKYLKSMVHISTCYANCNRKEGWIDEILYDLKLNPKELIQKIQSMNLRQLETINDSGLLRDWPNSYTFTKALTEHILYNNKENVPLVILRPSIITAAIKEPVPGWIDVLSSAGAIYAAILLGVLKFLPGSRDNIADIVPVDYVVNTILASSIYVMNNNNNSTSKFFIAQACSSVENTMTWGTPYDCTQNYFKTHQPSSAISPVQFKFCTNPQQYQIEFF